MATLEPPSAALALPPFRNEPFSDLKDPAIWSAYDRAVEQVRAQLGREYENRFGVRRYRASAQFASINPGKPGEVAGIHQESPAEAARMAVAAAVETFPAWRDTAMAERVQILLRAAALLRQRKLEMAAWMALETGKILAEADADAGEAIDFIEYYCRQALERLARPHPLPSFAGEDDELRYLPLGPGAVLPPWNFPLAILTGMTTAAILAGNTVVVKPSSDSATIAARFVELLDDAGLPAGVVNFLTGSGEVAGSALVADPRIHFVAFTGSKRVGLAVHQSAAQPRPGQNWIKRTILELGGKDAIVVDADADFDAAVAGVTASAFGFQGQKCSACSRLILHEAIHDRFVEALVRRAGALQLGPAERHDTAMGPLINRAALERALSSIATAQQQGARLVLGGQALPGDGFFLPPTILVGVEPESRLAQEEVFAPVLAVLKCRDFAHGLAIANQSEYGLTGAVFTRDEAKLAQAAREFEAGNLYLNRQCTGAMVGSHPFGGFKMSGTDSKAGGPDYLQLFTQAKAIARRR